MEQLNYHQLTDRFLEKDFKYENEIYTVTLTIESEKIKSMTGYSEKEEVVKIPDSIVELVKKDIKDSL